MFKVNKKDTRMTSLSFVAGNLWFHKITPILTKIAEQQTSSSQFIHATEILTLKSKFVNHSKISRKSQQIESF